MSTAIWWIRRDLRLSDNQALAAALRHAEYIVPVFVLDPKLLNSPFKSDQRHSFLFHGLRALHKSLLAQGSYLVIRAGDPVEALSLLKEETGAVALFAEADYSSFARARDARVAQILPLHLTEGLTIHPTGAIVRADGKRYSVFTPYSRAWQAAPWPGAPLPAPARISTPPGIRSEALPEAILASTEAIFPSGEDEAQRRLAAFTSEAINQYEPDRNRLDEDGTSGLSPYLRFGMLSARQAAWAARQAEAQAVDAAARRSAETWLKQLIWREFYIAVLFNFPQVSQTAFRPGMSSLPWLNDPEDFAAWAEGQSGYPVVDAGMRQMLETGWMHNRARMITAAFLVKDLLVDWRWGERFFMQYLVDGDPAANNGGWQWAAGTGTDAAPYFRVFNPVLQGKRFDPRGAYIRRWVPELRGVPDGYVHVPWELPAEVQRQSGCIIGKDYLAPIVDHAAARRRALAAYRQTG